MLSDLRCSSEVSLHRIAFEVGGQVQGVGFRPFVYRIALATGVTGWVANTAGGALIEAQGRMPQLARFAQRLMSQLPPLARVRTVVRSDRPPQHEREFRIIVSEGRASSAERFADVTVDTAVCDDCVAELLSPHDRREHYPLINCTQCGPRFSIIRRTPYDRCNTTMAGFEMCPACRAEYADPGDRRFHAQPISCHDCGPQVELVNAEGESLGADPIGAARKLLIEGKILAIKGIGGFHLAARADCDAAVRRLRALKHREAKPLAIMVSRDELHTVVKISAAAAELIGSPVAPIVLASRRPAGLVCDAVAPLNHRLGVLLPYTPIQHLLFAGGQSAMPPLVMTSANDSGAPLVIDNNAALDRLCGMCDALLWHDRSIERPVDDSVLIDMADEPPIPLRRSRGFVPTPIALPAGVNSDGLAMGGDFKSTVAVVRGGDVVLSQHLGELTHLESFIAFKTAVRDLQEVFHSRPDWIAHDLHPAYFSTMFGRALAAELGIPNIAIQHHHAHAAAVMAEHGLCGKVLAIVCDGTGFGADRTTWGGELLLVDYADSHRLAHLRLLRLPGGDAAARDPTRCALALLHQALGNEFADSRYAAELLPDAATRRFLLGMIKANLNCATSSGAGRYFDAVAALLGVCRTNEFEAQAAMALEATATNAGEGDASSDQPLAGWIDGSVGQIDLSPVVRDLLHRADAGEPPGNLAAAFHEQFALAWSNAVQRAVEKTGVRRVVISGGVFCNALLTRQITKLLHHRGCDVYRHTVVPPNDGGLALGQAAIAATWYRSGHGKVGG